MAFTSNIFEVFDSIQGEGELVGLSQIFIRFAGCNLNCSYCDTRRARVAPRFAKVYNFDGVEIGRMVNPVGGCELLEVVEELAAPHNHSISLTGGEPLIQARFLGGFLPVLRSKGNKILLETNGTLPQALAGVIDLVDWISMDIKLESSGGEKVPLENQRDFLRVSKGKVFIKIVVTKKTSQGEFEKAIQMIAEINPCLSLIIQPATSLKEKQRPTDEGVERLRAIAARKLRNVKVIPQMHKALGMK